MTNVSVTNVPESPSLTPWGSGEATRRAWPFPCTDSGPRERVWEGLARTRVLLTRECGAGGGGSTQGRLARALPKAEVALPLVCFPRPLHPPGER